MVAIDTMILVWGVRKDGDKVQIERAGWLFEELDEQNAQVIVPSVALAEFLVPVQSQKHADAVAQLTKRFIIAPFDVKCAALAARLFAEGKQDREMGVENARNLLKSDLQIVATAAVHGARTLYSDDEQCRKLAERTNLRAEPLPTAANYLFPQ